MTPVPFTVRRSTRETADTVTLELDPGPSGFAFEAGQFNMLYALGIGEVPISISGDPAIGAPLEHTVRSVGAVSAALCALRDGDAVGVRGPFGTDWRVAAAEGSDVVIVAGGIGLAPLRPAIRGLLARREAYGRISVLYGARTPADLLFRDEVEGWRGRFDVDVEVTVDAAGADWRGNVGVVPRLLARARFDAAGAVAMVCGPEVMMRFTVQALLDGGVVPDRILVSLERNMQCAIKQCGHCQLGPYFVCADGPVMPYGLVAPWLRPREM
ncbi:MAG TPA: FAD/NAD(P)-binding protein [Actinomycetota bacterium]